MTPSHRVTVVIATRNRPEQLRVCLASVQRAMAPSDEIVVVDSASDDPEPTRNVALLAGARIFRCEQRGAARARNLGARNARGGLIAFTDDDVVVDEGWLDAIAKTFSDASIDAVVGPVFELGKSPRALLMKFASFDAATETVTFSRMQEDWFNRLRFGAIGVGANMAIRRSTFADYGLFRESLGQGAPIIGDETFFLFSAVVDGATVANNPLAFIYHPAQLSERADEINRSNIAYLVYLGLKFPRHIPRMVKSLYNRLPAGGASAHDSMRTSNQNLIKSLRSAPRLLFAAWRFTRDG